MPYEECQLASLIKQWISENHIQAVVSSRYNSYTIYDDILGTFNQHLAEIHDDKIVLVSYGPNKPEPGPTLYANDPNFFKELNSAIIRLNNEYGQLQGGLR